MKKESYDQMNELESEYWWHVGRRHILAKLIRKYAVCFKNNLMIADVGCGTGGNYDFLEKFGNVTGIDNSPFAIVCCERKEKAVKFANGDTLPFSSDSQDLVTAFDVLEHVGDDLKVLKECGRVLKKNGKLIIAVPAYNSIWSSHDEVMGHRRRYSKENLAEKIEGAGFKIIKNSHCITFLFPLIYVYRKLISKFSRPKEKSAYITMPKPINRFFY